MADPFSSAPSYFTNPSFGVASPGQIPDLNLSGENALNKTTGTKKTKSYRYPLQRIDSKSDYLEIKIVDYIAPGYTPTEITTETVKNSDNKDETVVTGGGIAQLTQGSSLYSQKTKADYYICLPIPQNISDTNQITWGDDSINPLQSFGLQAATQSIKDPAGVIGGFIKSVTSGKIASDAITGLGANKDVISSVVGGAIVNAFGGNVSYESILSRATGQILNPNLELLFQGSNIRSFPFTFDLVPRDQREAQEVKAIIRALKQSMVPKTNSGGGPIASGIFIKSPKVFLISYKSGSKAHPFLNRFKACALLDMNISYTGSGTYSTYQDGTPVHMQMSLTFKELNPIYAEDYDTAEGKIGVGY